MASSRILDLDNVTIPTTIAGLRSIIPSHQPVQLTFFSKHSKDLPNYVPVASCGFAGGNIALCHVPGVDLKPACVD